MINKTLNQHKQKEETYLYLSIERNIFFFYYYYYYYYAGGELGVDKPAIRWILDHAETGPSKRSILCNTYPAHAYTQLAAKISSALCMASSASSHFLMWKEINEHLVARVVIRLQNCHPFATWHRIVLVIHSTQGPCSNFLHALM